MRNRFLIEALSLILLATFLISKASAQDTLVVGIYTPTPGQILRYDATGAAITPTPWISGFQGEGIAIGQGYPTSGDPALGNVANPVYIANVSAGTIEIANASVNNSPVVNANFITGLTGVANIALSQNGQTLYVAQESGNKLSEYNALTGTLLNSIAFTGAHDVVVGSDGSVYVTAYGVDGPPTVGVVKIDGSLNPASETQFIAPGNNGLNHATGMVFDKNGDLWVANVLHPISTTPSTSNFVSEYSPTGAFMRSIVEPQTGPNTNNLLTVFGLSLGKDGNIYAASFNGHEITEINTTTYTTSTFISLPGDNPKYATWESDAVTYVPEPKDYGAISLGAVVLLLMLRQLRQMLRKTA